MRERGGERDRKFQVKCKPTWNTVIVTLTRNFLFRSHDISVRWPCSEGEDLQSELSIFSSLACCYVSFKIALSLLFIPVIIKSRLSLEFTYASFYNYSDNCGPNY